MARRTLRHNINWLVRIILLASLILPVAGTSAKPVDDRTQPEAVDIIVQARDSETAAALVQDVGGTVTRELDVINAVGATVLPHQLAPWNRRQE